MLHQVDDPHGAGVEPDVLASFALVGDRKRLVALNAVGRRTLPYAAIDDMLNQQQTVVTDDES